MKGARNLAKVVLGFKSKSRFNMAGGLDTREKGCALMGVSFAAGGSVFYILLLEMLFMDYGFARPEIRGIRNGLRKPRWKWTHQQSDNLLSSIFKRKDIARPILLSRCFSYGCWTSLYE